MNGQPRVTLPGWLDLGAIVCWRPRLLLGLAVAICLPLAGLVGLALGIGQAGPPASLLLEAGSCMPPCWQGIELGAERRAELRDLLRDHPLIAAESVRLQWQTAGTRPDLTWDVVPDPAYAARAYFDGDILARLDLFAGGQVRLGDVLVELGPPELVRFCRRVAVSQGMRAAVTAILVMAGGTIEVWVFGQEGESHGLWPGMAVQQITYRAPAARGAPAATGNPAPWLGFGRIAYRPYSC